MFIDCIWVLPRCSQAGIGKGLMQHFLKEATKVGGATVLAYEGDEWFGYFDYMPASFFKRFGFRETSRDGTRVLLHLDLGSHQSPLLLAPKRRKVEDEGETVINVFCNCQCPWCGWMADKVMENVKHHGVTANVISTDSRNAIEEFGMSRGISINGDPVIKRMATWKEVKSALKRFKNKRKSKA